MTRLFAPKDNNEPRTPINGARFFAATYSLVGHPWLIIAGAAILLALPAILFGFPNGHDTRYHLVWHTHFADQLWGGELYPRWLRDAAFGHGGPVFFFYGPVGFYVSALASKLFAVDPHGRYAMAVAAAIALGLSGGAAYLWLRTLAGQRAAMLGAILYMAAPYHLAFDLYLRSAYGEFWAFVWMPLVLYFIRRARVPSIEAYAGLALSHGALMLTHLPTTLLFTPFAVAYAIALFGRDLRALLGARLVLPSVVCYPPSM